MTAILEQKEVKTIDRKVSTQIDKIKSYREVFEKKKKDYLSLELSGIEDKVGYEAVKSAHIDIRKDLKSLEDDRLTIKRELVAIIDGTAKSIRSEGYEVVEHLAEQRKIYEDEVSRKKEEKERIRREQEIVEQKKVHDRINALQQYGWAIDFAEASLLSDEDFANRLDEAKEDFRNKEEKRIAEENAKLEAQKREAEERAAEELRLKKEREELDAQRLAQQEAQAKIDAERKAQEEEAARIAAEKKAVEDQRIANENARIAAEKAAEEKKQREEMEAAQRIAEKKAAEEARVAAEKRAALMAPDVQKLRPYFKSFIVKEVSIEKLQDESVVLITEFNSIISAKAEEYLQKLENL